MTEEKDLKRSIQIDRLQKLLDNYKGDNNLFSLADLLLLILKIFNEEGFDIGQYATYKQKNS